MGLYLTYEEKKCLKNFRPLILVVYLSVGEWKQVMKIRSTMHIWQCTETFWVVITVEEARGLEVLVLSSGQGTGMLLKRTTTNRKGSHITENCPAQSLNSVKVWACWIIICTCCWSLQIRNLHEKHHSTVRTEEKSWIHTLTHFLYSLCSSANPF